MAILKHVDERRLASTSRLVVQTSEDAREISVKHIDEERAAAGREADANRVASANAATRSAQDQAADSDRARADADRKARDAQESARNAAAGQAQAERDAATAQQGQQAAQAESDQNRAAAMSSDQKLQQALREREELRARLLIQFNAILETRDTARGLVVNMSDVLFDSAKFTLRPAAH